MKTLQANIEEALYSKKGFDAKKSADMLQWEANLNKYANNSGQPIGNDDEFDLDIKPDGVYITQKSHAWGSLHISGIKGSKTPDFHIKYFDGRLYITENDITSLEGIFAPDCVFKGILIIARNKNLQSLVGCPERIDKSDENPRLGPGLTVSGNDNLNAFDGFPAGISLRDLWWDSNAKIDIQDPTFKRLLKKHIKK